MASPREKFSCTRASSPLEAARFIITRDPRLGKGELASTHFVVNRSRGESIRKWITPSVDRDQWIIVLLAMATDDSCPVGEDRVSVTVRRAVNGEIEYVLANRVYDSVVRPEDGVELAWPYADACTWFTNELKVHSSFLHILSLAASSYPPSQGPPFPNMWLFLPEDFFFF